MFWIFFYFLRFEYEVRNCQIMYVLQLEFDQVLKIRLKKMFISASQSGFAAKQALKSRISGNHLAVRSGDAFIS